MRLIHRSLRGLAIDDCPVGATRAAAAHADTGLSARQGIALFATTGG